MAFSPCLCNKANAKGLQKACIHLAGLFFQIGEKVGVWLLKCTIWYLMDNGQAFASMANYIESSPWDFQWISKTFWNVTVVPQVLTHPWGNAASYRPAASTAEPVTVDISGWVCHGLLCHQGWKWAFSNFSWSPFVKNTLLSLFTRIHFHKRCNNGKRTL